MNENDYFKKRIEDQIKWYSNKSTINKNWFQRCQIIQFVMAAFVTLSGISILTQQDWVSIAVPVLGALIGLISGILGLYKFQEKWIQYRTTAEQLKHEKYLYLTKSKPYDVNKHFNLLVSRVEFILSKENSEWEQYMKTDKENIV